MTDHHLIKDEVSGGGMLKERCVGELGTVGELTTHHAGLTIKGGKELGEKAFFVHKWGIEL